MNFKTLLLIFLITAPLIARGEDITILSGAVFNSESGQMTPGVDIKVSGSKIIEVGKNLTTNHSEVIDLRDYTILPGLIDVHTHLLILQKLTEQFEQAADRHVRNGLDFRLEQAKPLAESFLMSGITTVRELGNSAQFGDIKLRDAINSGATIGPRIIVSGPGISPKGGQFPEGSVEDWVIHEEYEIIESVDEGIAAVENHIAKGAKIIKIFSDAAPGPGFLTVEEMKAVVKTAHDRGLKVAAHAISDKSIATAIEAGVDSIEHGYTISDENLKLMAQKKIFFVPTDISIKLASFWIKSEHPDWSDDKILGAARNWQKQGTERLQRAIKLGVTIAMGSDMYIDFSDNGLSQGEAARELLTAYVEEGMTPIAALQSATLHAAKLVGYEHQLGVIKQDAIADLIAVKGDPTKDISALNNVVFVMQDGKVVKRP